MVVSQLNNRKKTCLPESTKAYFAHESETLLKDLKSLQAGLGKEALTLTVFRGYIRRLVGNPKVQRYLHRKHQDILEVLQVSLPETLPQGDELQPSATSL